MVAFFAAFAVIVWLAAAVPRVQAQTCGVARLRVSVRDSTGKPISEARVRIQTGSLAASIAVTAADGLAEFDNLNCGTWAVEAAKDGFEEINGRIVPLDGAPLAQVDLTLVPRVLHNSVDVRDAAAAVEGAASGGQQLHPEEVKDLPSRPASVTDALPLIPGVVRLPDGEIRMGGAGEQHSAFVVNQVDVTDPATGRFGQTVPLNSVETVNVMLPPFLTQYGRFTSGVVAVETRRAGDKWHADLNNPFPDFNIRSWRVRGLRGAWPRAVFGGPLIANRLYVMETFEYDLQKTPNRTLPYPYNLSKSEGINSFAQADYILSQEQFLTATFHLSPQHINFVDPSYFNPQPVTPSWAQHNFAGTVAHHVEIYGVLTSALSGQRFDATVGAQGPLGMIVTPTGNRGNYFGGQHREAGRTEWLEMWSSQAIRYAGTHEWKLGSSLTRTSDDGQFTAKPVQILGAGGELLRRIDFTGGGPYHRTDLETALFAHDHWNITPELAVDLGARMERQNIAGGLRFGPRGGLSWSLFRDGATVVRAGYGIFYDRVPLSVYTFDRYPQRVITGYAADGSMIGTPVPWLNLIGTAGAGGFRPHSATWNAQIEHAVSNFLKLRAGYTDTRSAGLVVLQPQLAQGSHALVLNDGGHSGYREAEFTVRFAAAHGQYLFAAYARSLAHGDLNDFGGFLGNFPNPLIQPNVAANLPGDLPNRFLAWGRVSLPWKFRVLPLAEYRNGLPYAALDALGNYAGAPNGTRFPNYFSLDARVLRDVRIGQKYTLRLSGSGANLTRHFNPLAVHLNIADPAYGVFFGENKHLLRADCELIF